jgi:hypothetical protein
MVLTRKLEAAIASGTPGITLVLTTVGCGAEFVFHPAPCEIIEPVAGWAN